MELIKFELNKLIFISIIKSEMEPTEIMHAFIKKACEIGGAFQKPEYHGIFQCGTVVRFLVDEKTTFTGFSDSKTYEFPDHRLRSEAAKPGIMANNEREFQRVIAANPNYASIIKSAYYTLINDGYPYPGGEGADRNVIPLPEYGAGLVYFIYRSIYVFQCAAPGLFKGKTELTIDEMDFAGGDGRRNDYMVPKLVSLITPTLEVIKLA